MALASYLRTTTRPSSGHVSAAFAVAIGLAAIALLGVGVASVSAQSVDTTLWVANNTVRSVVRSGGTIYIGGDFTRVGPSTGCWAAFDATTGTARLPYPRVAGFVYATVPDGSGGWYIGGGFSAVRGQPRNNLAHLDAAGRLLPWNPGSSDIVYALAVSAGVVYAGGAFTSIGGQSRNYIAALDTTAGGATAWNPNASSTVLTLAVSGSTVYAGGLFSTMGGQPRNYIAAIDAGTGSPTTWNPGADNWVRRVVVSAGTIYAGGFFANMGGQPRNHIASITAGGAVTGWNPNASDIVYALEVNAGLVYAGGNFLSIGGQSRSYVAELDPSGNATSWNPSADGAVRALAIGVGTIYAGGMFSNIGGQQRFFLAALDSTTGVVQSWNPSADESVLSLAASGATVAAGGDFTSLGGAARAYVAALSASTGAATAWHPTLPGVAFGLAVGRGAVYVAGNQYVAAIDSSNANTLWNDAATGSPSSVLAVALRDTTVYVGGSFTTVAGQARLHLAALGAAAGVPMAWNPVANNDVNALAVNGSLVYAGGLFTTVFGQIRNHIAAIDAASGAPTAWNPNASDVVRALVFGGNTVYAGGVFTTIGGQARNRIAALDAATGAATSWNPNANSDVDALAASGSAVFAGGAFSTIGGQARSDIAALDAASGNAAGWSPPANGSVEALAVAGDTLYAGGSFASINGAVQAFIARIGGLVLTAVSPSTGGNAGSETVTASGSGIEPGATVTLFRGAQPSIVGSDVVVAPDGGSVSASLDLTGAAPGGGAVIVTNPDAQAAALPGAFTVSSITAPQLRVDIVGRDSIRANYPTAFDLVVNNQGNVDAVAVPLWITGIPLGASVGLGFPLSYPGQDSGEPVWSQDSLTFTNSTGRYLVVVIPRIPPGSVSRRINLTVPPGVASFQLGAAVTPTWGNTAEFRSCLTGAGVIQNGLCAGVRMAALSDSLANGGGQGMSGIAMWSKVAFQCEGATDLTSAENRARQVLDYMRSAVESGTTSSICTDQLVARWRDRLNVVAGSSVDPNDKLGLRQRLSVRQNAPYTVSFENQSSAGRPARSVRVMDNLDLSRLDPSTINLGTITIADAPPLLPTDPRATTFSPPDVPLRPGMSVRVRVTVDRALGTLTWDFKSIDPATGDEPSDPNAGFLTQNAVPPAGQGSVQFNVMPIASLGSGTGIQNVAAITFDGTTNPTPGWTSTVDNTPPQSHVLPLASHQDSAAFTVRWGTVAPTPDLKDFTILASRNGGPYWVWRNMTIATADTFRAQPGASYQFYSVARDTLDNQEPARGAGDTQTTVANPALAVDETPSPGLALEGAEPNPAVGELRVAFTLAGAEPARLELIDVAGRVVMRREVGALGSGRHVVSLDPGRRPRAGLYFLRLAQQGRVARARLLIL